MRDLASSYGSAPGEQPLPPTVTNRSGADGRQQQEEGPILPPFFPSGGGHAPSSDSGDDRSEADFWNALGAEGDAAQSVTAFAPGASAENFPMDAFFIPEGAEHVPAGVDASAAQRLEHRLELDPSAIAERLEMVARRLRLDGERALKPMLDGDTLDALLGRVLGDYLDAQKP
jgi:hypothetical protein